MNRECENSSNESYLLTYLLTYPLSDLVRTKCGFEHLFQESLIVLASDFSLLNLTYRDKKDSFFHWCT